MINLLYFRDPDARRTARLTAWFLTGSICFLVSGCVTLGDLRYRIWGQTVDASISQANVTKKLGKGKSTDVLAVDCFFNDNGVERLERVWLPMDVPAPRTTISIQYIPGVQGAVRLAGETHLNATYIFLFGLIAVAAFWFDMYRKATHGTYRA